MRGSFGIGKKHDKNILEQLKQCALLQANPTNTDNVAELDSALERLVQEYSHTDVILNLINVLPEKKLEEYIDKAVLVSSKSRNIKTIGVYWYRMHNGGVEKVLATLVSIWSRMGYKVILYTSEQTNELDYAYSPDVKRVVLPETKYVRERLLALEKSIKDEAVDVFVNNDWTSPYLLQDILLVKSLAIPYILYTHGHFTALYWNCADFAMKSSHYFRLCDAVLSLAEINARFYDLCGCNSILIQNPIPQELSKVKEIADLSLRRILWVGRIADGKRFEDAIVILKKVRQQIPDVEMDVVGTTDKSKDMDCIVQATQKEGLDGAIHFHGYQTDTAPFYKKAGLMLMTSEKEGYPTVLLESKAYGVPTVMYELPYLSLVKDGKGILTSNIGNIEEMSEHIIKLMSDYEYRVHLGKDARSSFENLLEYDLEGTWRDIFESVSDKEKVVCNECKERTDAMMLQMLINQLTEGIEVRCDESMDYRIGRMLLMLPRKVFHMIKLFVIN